jgi:hypothetical protein
MKRFSEWWVRRGHRRDLAKAREEAQLMFDYAAKKRSAQGWDRFRDIMDFFTERELRVWREITAEEWALSEILGERSEWGNPKSIATLLGEDSPVGFTTVKEDRSTQITWDYIEQVGLEARCTNGKWGSRKGDWRTPVEGYMHYPEGLIEAGIAYRDAETEEEKQAILEEYRNKGYGIRKYQHSRTS